MSTPITHRAIVSWLFFPTMGMLFGWFLGTPENQVVAGVAGKLGHFARFLVRWAFGIVSGVPIGFAALGLTKAILGFVNFGALIGLRSRLTLLAFRKAGYYAYLAEKNNLK